MLNTEKLNKQVNDILYELKYIGIDVSDLQLDHIAYQTCSVKEYEEVKLESMKYGSLVKEFEIDGRRVSIYKYKAPLVIKNYTITAFEIIELKPNQICDSGLSHIEFVINSDFKEFIEKYKDIDWDLRAMERDMFPKISINLKSGIGVKFHNKDILKEI